MGNSNHTLIIIKRRGRTRKNLTLINHKKKWKTGQRLVMNNNVLDIRRQGGRIAPTSTNNKRMEAIITVVLEKGPPKAREAPFPESTWPDTTSLGTNDPNPLGDLPLPKVCRGIHRGATKENQDPKASGAQGS